jgi:hypothetical protein
MNTACDIPFPERTAGEVYDCVMDMGTNADENTLHAYSTVWSAPGSATALDWAIVIFMPILFIGLIGKVIDVWRRI